MKKSKKHRIKNIISFLIFFAVCGMIGMWLGMIKRSYSTGKEMKPASGTDVEQTLKEDENLVVTRAVLYLEEGEVLIDEKGNYISEVYDSIEQEDLENNLERVRYTEAGKVGYLNSMTGEILIDAQYTYAAPFKKIITVVGDDNAKWIISESGEKISEKYEDAFPPEDRGAYIRVKQNGKWGIAKRKGEIVEMVLPCDFSYINEIPFLDTFITGVKDEIVTIISIDSRDPTIIEELEDYCEIEDIMLGGHCCVVKNSEGYSAIVNTEGETILEPKYKDFPEITWIGIDTNIITTESVEGYYGAILCSYGEVYEIIPPIYKNKLEFGSMGCAVAINQENQNGVVDIITREWHELEVDTINNLKWGRALATKDGKYVYFDAEDVDSLYSGGYDYAEEFEQPYTVIGEVIGDDVKKGLINRREHEILPCEFQDITILQDSGYVITEDDDGMMQLYYMKNDDDYDWYTPIFVKDGISGFVDEPVDNSCVIKTKTGWSVVVLEEGKIVSMFSVKDHVRCSEFYKIDDKWWGK